MKKGYRAVLQFKAIAKRFHSTYGTACDMFPFEPRYCVIKASAWVSGDYSMKSKRATPLFTVEFERKDFNMDKKGGNIGKLVDGWQAAYEFFADNPRARKCYVLDNRAFIVDAMGADCLEELAY